MKNATLHEDARPPASGPTTCTRTAYDRGATTSLVDGLTEGDIQQVDGWVNYGGAWVLEVDTAELGTLTIGVRTPLDGLPALDVQAFALEALDSPSPLGGPVHCATSPTSTTPEPGLTRIVVTDYDPATCQGVTVVVVNPELTSSINRAISATMSLGDQVDSTVTNGTIRLGINAQGHLNVPGYFPSSGTGTSVVGLRYEPTNADAIAPGCLCEGWGVADTLLGASGWANADQGGSSRIDVLDAEFDATTARSEVLVDDTFRVVHDFRPAPETVNLYEITVTITNDSTWAAQPVYRRVMDWDVESTAFSEYVTIAASGSTVPEELTSPPTTASRRPTPRTGPATSEPRGCSPTSARSTTERCST